MYLKPKTLEEAVRTLGQYHVQVLAGGTDVYPALAERQPPLPLVDITAIREIRGIRTEQDCFWIGGLTTWTDILSAELPRCFDALKGAAREIGAVQIQNRGTIAGNLCNASPAADSVPALLILNAEVELLSGAGTRRMPLADFIVGNRKTLLRADELLTAVIVPRDKEDARSAFLKLGARRYLVISIAMVAAAISIDLRGLVRDVRIAVGSCSARAQRLSGLEAGLTGLPADSDLPGMVSPAHLGPLSPIDDLRATAEYRSDAALTLVRRTLGLCLGSL